MVTELQEKGMDEKAFTNAMKLIEEMRATWRHHAQTLKEMLAQMSEPQIKKAKALLRGFVSFDQIDRLVLAGRGEIPDWLANSQRSLPARTCRILSVRAKKDLSDPDMPVEVFTPRGVHHDRIGNLNAFTLCQVVDPVRGLLPAQDQAKRALVATKEEKPIDEEVETVFDWQPVKGGALMKSRLGHRMMVTGKQIEQMYRSFSR